MKQTFIVVGNNIPPFISEKGMIDTIHENILFVYRMIYEISDKNEYYKNLLEYIFTRKNIHYIGDILLLNGINVEIYIQTFYLENNISSNHKLFFNENICVSFIKENETI